MKRYIKPELIKVELEIESILEASAPSTTIEEEETSTQGSKDFTWDVEDEDFDEEL